MLKIHDIIENKSLTTEDKIVAIETFLKNDLINLTEATKLLNVSRPTINRYIDNGNLSLLIDKGQFKVLSKNEVSDFKISLDATKDFFKKKEPK
ncbi:DNA-binding protein [Carnobacterium maltaromaticum]|uniref:DNA-binding protein n=1 Tax=Carnobacterium maltaromaticum TaxID=2751 RepID=A0AAW9JYQ5_CARML|nr:DNA-binding protein [Carnobacterium maltaromaticum]MDW5525196.1 DNA-binding protein [Carnobacterium maltaromaticum]MDZ5760688.1 DNA-binding protein [Carnobacterium maltaromaticum]